MGVSIITNPNAAIIETGGGWSNNVDANTISGQYRANGTAGQSVAITGVFRALHMFFRGAAVNGLANVSLAGATRKTVMTGCANVRSAAGLNRSIAPLVRGLSLPGLETTQTVTLTTPTPTTQSWNYDAFVPISGPKLTPTNPYTLMTVGDSLTLGTGLYNVSSVYANELGSLLADYYQIPVTVQNRGSSASGLPNLGNGATSLGGIFDIVNGIACNNSGGLGAAAAVPKWLTILFGYNDLSGNNTTFYSVEMFIRLLRNLLFFIEDVFDTTQVKVAVGTPYHASGWVFGTNMSKNIGSAFTMQGVRAVQNACRQIQHLQQMFPNIIIANVQEDFNRCGDLINPNNNNSDGLHSNDMGHFWMAMALFYALTGLDSDAAGQNPRVPIYTSPAHQ